MSRRWRVLAATLLAAVMSASGCGGGGGAGGFGLPGGSVVDGAGAAGPGIGGSVGSGGESVAGVGSGGTGISGEGVGSGGTGVSADAGIGSVDGFGSIIVNGTRFDTTGARIVVADAPELRLGMTVRVLGSLAPDLANGEASLVLSAADLRGPVESVQGASFTVLGVRAHMDAATVFAGGLTAASQVYGGMPVQVHGLPGAHGELRVTRIERLQSAGTPVLSGVVAGLDAVRRTFRIGDVQVHYTADLVNSGLVSGLANGQLVRVRASGFTRPLQAVMVEPWNPVRSSDGTRLTLGGLVTQFAGLGSLQVDGIPVDASGAQVSGGPASRVAAGARVEVAGTMRDGVLVASRLRLRDVQGTSATSPGPTAPGATATSSSYSASGPIGAFRSASSFKVRGQDIDAGRAGVAFVGGTLADLRNGRRVLVTGSRVQDDVLIADRVEFQ